MKIIQQHSDVADKSFADLTSDDDIIAKIEDNVASWFSYFKDNNENAVCDMSFALGEQWEAHELGEFHLRQKLCLTVNVLYSMITQILAENRKNTPQIKVRAMDDKTPQAAINNVEGLLRHIAYESSSDIAYQSAFAQSLLSGYGAFRVITEYESPDSFDQVVRIIPINDHLKAYFDPNAKTPTKSDGEYCGVYSTMSLEEFKATYPNIDNPESLLPPNSWTDDFNWRDNDNNIVICEHFQKVWRKTKLYFLSNGESVLEENLKEKLKEIYKQEQQQKQFIDMHWNQITQGYETQIPEQMEDLLPHIKIEDERETEVFEIKWYKLIKGKILEETTFHGKHLPIVFVDGDSHYINNKQKIKSFIKFSKDAQKFLNYTVSENAQWLKVGHKGKFMATETQIGDYKELWRNPEKPSAALLYKPDPRTQGGAPIYVPPSELPVSLVQAPGALVEMIQTITGRYEANKGAQGNEMSGVAISNRAKQGNLATFVYIDNLNQAVEQANRIALGLIPYLYDTQRLVQIRDQYGKTSQAKLNSSDEDMIKKEYKLDVSVTIGAGFEIQKLEAFNQMMQMININPQVFNLIADLLVANTDLENTPQIVERFRNFIVPPQVLAQEQGKPLPEQKPDPQMVIADRESQARLMEAQAKIEKVQIDAKTAGVKANAEMGKAKLDYDAKVVDSMSKMHANSLKADNEHMKHHLARISAYQQLHEQQQGMPY